MIKRNKSIKIRLTDEEHQQLIELKTCAELATWMRNYCLNAEKEQTIKTDPNLLRELNKIGVNLNQIAKGINQHSLVDQIAITNHLSIISDQLNEILKKL